MLDWLRQRLGNCDICGAASHNLRANQAEGENGRLRNEIIAARNFLAIGDTVNADRHLRAALPAEGESDDDKRRKRRLAELKRAGRESRDFQTSENCDSANG